MQNLKIDNLLGVWKSDDYILTILPTRIVLSGNSTRGIDENIIMNYIMSNFDFMKNAKSFIDAKAESFLKENNVNKPLSDIKKTLNREELIFKEEEEVTANKAEYTVAYINELMTTVLNEVCNKNGTSFEDEYDSFCIHYNSKAD